MVFLPEFLENSKLISSLTENLTFKLSDVIANKEISKCFTNKETLIKFINNSNFLTLADDHDTANYHIAENFTVFNILNFPQKMTKDEFLAELNINLNHAFRVIKKTLFWHIATDDKALAADVESKLKDKVFGDTKVRFEVIRKDELIKTIVKAINMSNYHKDAHDLKHEKPKGGNNNSNNKNSRTNSEAFSWRKKSNEGNSVCSNEGLNNSEY